MNSLCIFVHYGNVSKLPYSEESYIIELKQYFTEVLLVTNQREFNLGELSNSVTLKMVKNEGYDFGMFYKATRDLDWDKYDRIALANDSNLLIKPLSTLFTKGEKLGTSFWGAIDSYEKPWFSSHDNNHHYKVIF